MAKTAAINMTDSDSKLVKCHSSFKVSGKINEVLHKIKLTVKPPNILLNITFILK